MRGRRKWGDIESEVERERERGRGMREREREGVVSEDFLLIPTVLSNQRGKSQQVFCQ